jgi:hypothetical protein
LTAAQTWRGPSFPGVQPGREHGGPVLVGPVPAGRVIFHRACHEPPQPGSTRLLAGLPGCREALVPSNPREEAKVRDGNGRRPFPGTNQRAGSKVDRRRDLKSQAMPPVGCEHLERTTLLVPHRAGFEEKGTVEIGCLDAVCAKRVLQPTIALNHFRFIPPVPEHGARARLLYQASKHRQGITPGNNEPRSPLLERHVERQEGMVEPPAGGRAHRPLALVVRVPDEDRDDRAAAPDRRRQRRVILQTKILPKPDDGWGHIESL